MPSARFIAFSAQTRMSGVDLDGRQIRKGAADAVRNFAGGRFPRGGARTRSTRVSVPGRDPAGRGGRTTGSWAVVHLKDIVKGG